MNIPTHVAIIPDGNRRWARKNNLPVLQGHRVSAEKVLPKLIERFAKEGVKYFTFWALSPENFTKRSEEENSSLPALMKFFLEKKVNELHKNNLRIKVIGDINAFSQDLQDLISRAIDKTKDNTGMTMIFGINYGGRNEIIRAIKKLQQVTNPPELTPETFSQYLDTKDIPDPDLIIRTGGDKRISGFMLWQSEYAEYMFYDKLFPEFTEQDCVECLQNFTHRERRFGQ